MGDFPTLQTNYRRLPVTGDESDSSHESVASPLLNREFEEHGYTMQEEVGRGGSGRVFLVTNSDGDPYVIKQMNSRDRMELDRVQQEVMILKTINCGYIVSYVDSFEDKEVQLFYIVMEYCAGSDLFKRMKTQTENGFFEEQQILDWFVQICLALQYIHHERRNILHRDIKPQNIFLTEDGYINLGDFGYSKVHGRADPYTSSVRGAELYQSPEVDQNRYTSKSDIWSLGWVLYDLCRLDVWSDLKKRRFQQASHNVGHPLEFSDWCSKDLQELIKEMLSCDPEDRPSADEILAKPFLRDAVNRNRRFPEALERRFMMSLRIFDETYNEHYDRFKALVTEWGKTTASLEEVHHKCTAGTLAGSVIGAAGGITAVVGAILAPFTFGASLIVTGVGIGVGVAGGVTGAASSVTNTVKQRSLRENIQRIQQNFTDVTPLLESLNALRRVLRVIQKFRDFVSDSSDNVQMSSNVDRRRLVCATELMHLGLLANVGRIAAQTARVGRAVAEAIVAVTGVLSGILVIVDTAFIVMDSIDIHQMRQGQVDDPERVRSSLLKSIAQMRKTHTDLCNVLKEIKETREELKYYIEVARAERD
ncbi:probable serine/threonine-protein kinase DDB_G0280717 [Sinocyclocheilus rhinocerous]|uniref:probable serine/threonine-protein kinase DDB_G0280717 n=1 Tax=Sinocyclocheilus rhinocerous TaxID=307959 RepID=UPI0007BAAD02|nr:PREDICTED: probable serine/threonine-protein kinase DDB_G0280717 [Sinocyclocheilus rhinocerous]